MSTSTSWHRLESSKLIGFVESMSSDDEDDEEEAGEHRHRAGEGGDPGGRDGGRRAQRARGQCHRSRHDVPGQ